MNKQIIYDYGKNNSNSTILSQYVILLGNKTAIQSSDNLSILFG